MPEPSAPAALPSSLSTAMASSKASYHSRICQKAVQTTPFLRFPSIFLVNSLVSLQYRPLISSSILTGAASLLYTGYIYQTYIIGDFRKYPEPVAIKLRRALFYTNIELNPKKAVEYYRQALRVAAEVGMDQFSDEIIGIKIQLAALMEKVHHYQKAIDVLEIVRADCLKYVDTISKLDGRAGDRTRVLGKTVGISVKLGELYANEYVGDPEAAEKSLVEGVETSLRELQRRESEGVKEGEGPWMSHEEIGGALECMHASLHILVAGTK